MSGEFSGSIRPVSARYAAQIKELLTHQVRERIAEAEQAARRPVESAKVGPAKADIVNPLRDPAEASSRSSDERQPLRLSAPAAYAPGPAPGQQTTPMAALLANPAPPASFLDLKV